MCGHRSILVDVLCNIYVYFLVRQDEVLSTRDPNVLYCANYRDAKDQNTPEYLLQCVQINLQFLQLWNMAETTKS